MIPSRLKKLRRAGLLGCLAFAAVIPFAYAGPQESLSSAAPGVPAVTDPVVGSINQEPVSAAEYRMVMERQTALVYGYFKNEKGLDDHLGYWSETSGPTGPLAKLREMVRDELVRIKVVQGLAREKGLIADTAFASFQNDYTRENARRRAALDAGQVVYGPKQYRSVGIYYYACLGDLRYKLLQALAKEAEPGISEDEIKAAYDGWKKTSDTKPFDDEIKKRIREVLAAKQAEKQVESLGMAARVEMNADLLRGIIPRIDPDQGTARP